ncbi:hypothetical protein HK097_006849, partial [Rhizophlyctis rosea]
MAVHDIVTSKLYRTKNVSLEKYFREEWKISRAQVYRFMDCAVVLKQLEDLSPHPSRERICRSLKRLAKNRHDMRKLWTTVLTNCDNDSENVSSTQISETWKELLQGGVVTGLAESLFETGFKVPEGVVLGGGNGGG